MAENEANLSYYFVPLGRERGGYLDVLGLPPTASDVEARKAEVSYQNSLAADFKSKRKQINAKLEAGDITQEEFDAQEAVLKEEKTRKLTELNESKKTFKAAQAEQRDLKNKGLKGDSQVWLDMYQPFGENLANFWRFVRKHYLYPILPDYLDVLGLPPTASDVEARKAEVSYQNSLAADFKSKRKQINAKLEAGDITQEEFDAQEAVLKEEKTRKLTELNKAKKIYETAQARKRDLRNKELKNDSPKQYFEWQFDERYLQELKLLDLLYIPLDKIKEEVEKIRKHIEKDFETRQEELKAKQETRKVTQEEFDEEKLEQEAEKKQQLANLDELAAAATDWLAMQQSLGKLEEGFWDIVLRGRPIPQISLRQLEGIQQRWLDTNSRDLQLEDFDYLPSSISKYPMSVDMAALQALVTERNLMGVLAADMWWAKLAYTNRTYWSQKISMWMLELLELGPRLGKRRIEESKIDLEFPSLCQPFPLSIDRLEQEDLEDVSRLPERVGDMTQRVNLGTLLAALLERSAQSMAAAHPVELTPESQSPVASDQESKPIPRQEVKLGLTEFMKLLEVMSDLKDTE